MPVKKNWRQLANKLMLCKFAFTLGEFESFDEYIKAIHEPLTKKITDLRKHPSYGYFMRFAVLPD
jgi:hypothetical protein